MTEDTRCPSSGAMSDINITPLIDVMLVLLIIFMVVTPVASKGLDISLPRDASELGPPRPEPLVLEVRGDGLRLNRSALTGLDDLGERLRDVFLARSDKTLFVRAEGTLRYAQVMSALDVARGAGAERIGILGSRAEEAALSSR